MSGPGASASVRALLSTLSTNARPGTGRFSCIKHGEPVRRNWRFLYWPGKGIRLETPDGKPHTLRWADGRELYDFGPSGPLEVLPEPNEAWGWRPAPGVPEIEQMLRPRSLSRWMGLQKYELAERGRQGRAPWGSLTRVFDLTLGAENALRLTWDHHSQALIEMVHEPDPSRYSVTIDEWEATEPQDELLAWRGPTRLAHSWPSTS